MNLLELLFILGILLPGILLMAINEKELYMDILPNEAPPSLGLRLLNHVILAVPFAILGLFFYKRAGFEDALSLDGIDPFSFGLGLLCAFFNIVVYYWFFKRNVAEDTFKKVEKTRQQLGISTRCLYGGIVEEVVFRFGLMSFFSWVCNLLTPSSNLSIWTANILASILFALAHLPSVYQLKTPVTTTILLYSMGMNVVVGLICGWLYWQNGLIAAIMCHMLFHLVWYAAERIDYKLRVS